MLRPLRRGYRKSWSKNPANECAGFRRLWDGGVRNYHPRGGAESQGERGKCQKRPSLISRSSVFLPSSPGYLEQIQLERAAARAGVENAALQKRSVTGRIGRSGFHIAFDARYALSAANSSLWPSFTKLLYGKAVAKFN